jgi:hypothetical protein
VALGHASVPEALVIRKARKIRIFELEIPMHASRA